MAWVSRKDLVESLVAEPVIKPLYKTVVYARLSAEDREALSLENQILIVSVFRSS